MAHHGFTSPLKTYHRGSQTLWAKSVGSWSWMPVQKLNAKVCPRESARGQTAKENHVQQSKQGELLELELAAKGSESHGRHKQGAVRGAEWADVGDGRQIERKCLCFLWSAQGWAGSI